LENLKNDLKLSVSNHEYVDRITGYSPNKKDVNLVGSVRNALDQKHSEGSLNILSETDRKSLYSSVTPNQRPSTTWKYNSNMNSTMKSRLQEPSNLYIPGISKFEPESSLKKVLDNNTTLKEHTTKKWLKKKVQFDKFREPMPGMEQITQKPSICP